MPLVPGLSFVALDFECANSSHGSVCSVGVTRVVDGVVHEPRHWFIRPVPPFDFIAPYNAHLTGITVADLADAPGFDYFGPHLVRNIGAGIVVGHCVRSADLSMFEQAWHANRLGTSPTFRALCTHELARAVRPGLSSYRLNDLVRSVLGEDMKDHHNAGADAHATARLAVALLAQNPALLERYSRLRPGRPHREPKPPKHPGMGNPLPPRNDLVLPHSC